LLFGAMVRRSIERGPSGRKIIDFSVFIEYWIVVFSFKPKQLMNTSLKKLIANSFRSSFFLSMACLACGQPSLDPARSRLNITNGLLESGEFPEVVRLDMRYGAKDWLCTATFITHHQALTAAHCVEGLDPAHPEAITVERPSVGGQTTKIPATSFVRHPSFVFDPKKSSPYDLAVITIPGDSSIHSASLGTSAPRVGQLLTIVGYGVDRFYLDHDGNIKSSGGRVKRFGNNFIQQTTDGLIIFYGSIGAHGEDIPPGQNAASGQGDSGGPLFVDGKLVGVASGSALAKGELPGTLAKEKMSRYVDLMSPSSKNFLNSLLAP
jgi:Trypsin